MQKDMGRLSKLLTITGATAITSAAIGYHLRGMNLKENSNSMISNDLYGNEVSKKDISKKNYVTVSRVKENGGYSTELNSKNTNINYEGKNSLSDFKVTPAFTLKSTNDLM